jgi:predicted nuclease of restriction endonuclease-like RecB superfamily
MLFSLSNLKKRSVRDADSEQAVVPKLLHGRAALRQLGQAIDLFEGFVGQPRSECDTRLLEAIMGDYRLGRCIEACLLTRYSFVQPSFASVLSPEQAASLSSHGITSPTDVRFALWDAANARLGGFAPAHERANLLAGLAAGWGLPPDADLIDRLATLDSDSAGMLERSGEPSTSHELLQQYNRGVVKTLLAHSVRVEIAVRRLPGAALKRLYFIAKRSGVLVDVESIAASSPEGESAGFTLTLYGPEQAFGTADKYGRRLADVSLDLIRSLLLMHDVEPTQVEATAHLILYDRPYRFHITPEILERLEYILLSEGADARGRVAETVAAYSVGSAVDAPEDSDAHEPTFDSLVEMRLYKEYRSLEKGGYTHGWMLQREPEPVLAPGVVFIPDFGFRRGDTHIFMEIAGFWSPSYRERKVAKLRALAAQTEQVRMILAVPHDALNTFAGLPFPIVLYKNKVVATDLLDLLDREYGSRTERISAAQEHFEPLRAEALAKGFVAEQQVAASLQAYTRTELLDAAGNLTGDGTRYVPGVGLFSTSVLERVRSALASALEAAAGGKLDVAEAEQLVCDLLAVPHVDLDLLLSALEGFKIERPSLFEAYLTA